jgi:hypothetical protein
MVVTLISGCTGRPLDLNRTPEARTPTVLRTVQPAASPTPAEARASATLQSDTPTPESTEVATEVPSTEATRTPTETAVVIFPVPAPTPTNEERWRARQLDRTILQPVQMYVAAQLTPLFWFDPQTSQVLEIGQINGPFPAQATFRFRSGDQEQAALEVPYRINVDFGLTAISEALRQRMASAGYTQTVEAFVFVTEFVEPQP